MTSRSAATVALVALLTVSYAFCAPLLAAQPSAGPVLAISVDAALVPSSGLKAALEAELGVSVAEQPGAAGQLPTISVVRLPSGNVEVSLQSRSVPRASREFVLSAALESERLETIALVAANLVRNEAASLLPDLRPLSPPAPKLTEPDPCDLHGEGAFGIDFAPGVGNSSTRGGREATRRLSLGFVGTLSSRLHGLEFSLGASIQTVSACGLQFAAGANIVRGPITGAQFAYGVNLAVGSTAGVQFAPVNLATGALAGVQLGVANFARKGLRGLEAGVLNVEVGPLHGVQLAISNYAGDLAGVQYGALNLGIGRIQGVQAGVANVAVDGVSGLEAGVLNVSSGDTRGLQIAVVNVNSGALRGLQYGVVNVNGGELRGLQFGVVNYADRSSASIGILSIQRRGRTSFDALSAIESGTFIGAITHGGRVVHNSYGFGVRTGKDGQRLVSWLALGVRVLSRQRLWVDLDAFNQHVLHGSSRNRTTVISGLRVPVTLRLFGGFGVVAAPSYQVMVTDDEQERTQSIFGERALHAGDPRVIGYPGLTLGVRWQIDHGA